MGELVWVLPLHSRVQAFHRSIAEVMKEGEPILGLFASARHGVTTSESIGVTASARWDLQRLLYDIRARGHH